MKTLWFFEDVNLFKILCPHKYAAYKDCHNFNHYRKDEYVYFEEDAANKIFLIDKGKVKIGYYTEEGDEIVNAILTKGEIFGEKAILGEDKRDEFAQSLDNDTTICPVGVETMHDLVKDNRDFSLKIYKFLGYRFKKLERRIKLMLFKDTKTRLMEFLKDLCDDYGYDCEETGHRIVKHPYTQKDIASLIGTSRPTLNSLLNELKESNLIDFNRKEIRLINLH